MLRSVLLHTDLTPEDDIVIPFATGLPALGARRAVLASVVDASGLEGPVIMACVDKARERLREHAKTLRDAGLEVEVRVLTGEVDRELLGLAVETGVDMMVSCTHGKSFLARLIAGSTSESLLSHAECPSMFVRFDLLGEAEHPSDPASDFCRSLLLPTDFGGPATRAFMGVLELPSDCVGTLHLLHVIDPDLDDRKLRDHEVGAEFQLSNLAALAAEHGIDASVTIRQGDVGETVLAEMRGKRVTGAVLGTRGRGPVADALLGSLSLTLLRQATCPVLVVP